MSIARASLYAISGVLIVELSVWCILLPWVHHQYTVGISRSDLWKPVVLLAVIGAAPGLVVYAIRSAMKVR